MIYGIVLDILIGVCAKLENTIFWGLLTIQERGVCMKGFGRVMLAVFAICYTFTCTMLFFSMNVRAYTDTQGMTYSIQAIAGVMLAIGAAVGLRWRK